MKIETSIQPRKNNAVRVTTPSGGTIEFTADESGRLVADVENQADLAFLLSLGDFFPADEADHVQAEAVLRTETGSDDLSDDEGDENAAPIEVATPPKPPRHGAKQARK